ncbi:MAG: putative PurR-regulated permease PerM [Brevundimonas sp.]|jgi:predicted PurR-regulated permease PerM
MRFSEPVRMSDDDGGPVWARNKRRRGSPPVVGFIVTLLALFGALTAVLGIKERSVAEGGATIDGWITAGWDQIKELTGQADEATDEALSETAEAAGRAGAALGEGAENAARELQPE